MYRYIFCTFKYIFLIGSHIYIEFVQFKIQPINYRSGKGSGQPHRNRALQRNRRCNADRSVCTQFENSHTEVNMQVCISAWHVPDDFELSVLPLLRVCMHVHTPIQIYACTYIHKINTNTTARTVLRSSESQSIYEYTTFVRIRCGVIDKAVPPRCFDVSYDR